MSMYEKGSLVQLTVERSVGAIVTAAWPSRPQFTALTGISITKTSHSEHDNTFAAIGQLVFAMQSNTQCMCSCKAEASWEGQTQWRRFHEQPQRQVTSLTVYPSS